MQSVLLFENEEDVGIWLSSHLEFHHTHIARSSAHDIAIYVVVHQLLSLQIEYSRYNIWPILWLLVRKDGVGNLWPLRIAG